MNIYDETPPDWKKIGEIDFSSGEYEFDFTVIWMRGDGSFVYAEDAGCSCPEPFADQTLNDVVEIPSLEEIKMHLESRNTRHGYDRSQQIVEMIERLHREGLR
jgi:hypothetical protein